MRIVHLSDMHYTKEYETNFEMNLLKPMLKDLKTLSTEKNIDLVVYSGDLIDKGGKSFDGDLMLGLMEFENKIIEPILHELGLEKDRFIIVPGNHDIQKDKDSSYIEAGLLSQLSTHDDVNNFMTERRGNIENWEGISRIKTFKEFEKEFYSLGSVSKFETIHVQEIGGIKVGIAALNSSWRCFDSSADKGRILLGESQLDNALKKFDDENCELKIALVHHPLDELHPLEAKEIQNKVYREFDIVFSGHVHFSESYSIHDLHGKTLIIKAPANWSGNVKSSNIDYLNGYSILDYNLEGEIELMYRKYSRFKNGFIANNDRGDEEGKVYYNFPSSNQLSIVKKKQKIFNLIRDVHLDAIDNHLLTFNTDTFAPKKLNDLFVAPKLTYKKEVDIDGEFKRLKDEEVKFTELLISDENYTIFGTKESGKTVLLDKILLEMSNKDIEYNSIPIYITFKEIQKNNNIDVLIAKYLQEPVKDIRNGVLDEYKKVLLIDNIDFNDVKNVFKLMSFLESNKNYRYIATSFTTSENEIPVSVFKSEFNKNCNIVFINQFQTKEIKELLKKWFSNRDDIIPNDKSLDEILNTFKSLNLPRTPMAVSMFLWIIEKQENYVPINNAQMLENFLEKVFSKSDMTEVKSSDFNFKNKETLLSEIAYFMYEKDDLYYRVEQAELIKFISGRFKVRMYPFDPVEILLDFIKKGIFSKQTDDSQTYIRFKFSCFYHYYLMKNINRKPEFKKHILKDENIIYFMEEIEYYTGINMEDTQLFTEVIFKMENKYQELSHKFTSLDSYFETDKNLVEYIEKNELNDWLKESKETESDYEDSKDEELNEANCEIVNKSVELSPMEKFERYWVLAAKVIKNSEEIEEAEMRIKAIRSTVNCAILYMTMYKSLLQIIEEKALGFFDEEFKEQFFVVNRLLPVFQQILITQTLGTGKLTIPIEQILKEVLEDKNNSEIEKFVYIFLYSDLKGERYKEYISRFMSNFKSWYMKDLIFTKLFEYYIRKDTPKEDERYLKLGMVTLLEKDSKGKDLHRKGNILSKLEDIKIEANFKSV